MTSIEIVDLSQSDDETKGVKDDRNDDRPKIRLAVPVEDLEVELLFMGKPIPQARHRQYGKIVVNPNKDQAQKCRDMALQQIRDQYPGNELPLFPYQGVELKVWFLLPCPDDFFINRDRTRPKGFLESKIVPAKKPDVDNLLKFLMDGLSGVLFQDDSQVCSVLCHKWSDIMAPFDGRTVVVAKYMDKTFDIDLPKFSYNFDDDSNDGSNDWDEVPETASKKTKRT